VATIFLPLTVLTGFFGMNFNWLISHIGPAWAFWGLGIGLSRQSALRALLRIALPDLGSAPCAGN